MKQRLITLLTVLCSFTSMFAYDALVNNIYYNLDTSAKTAEVTYRRISTASADVYNGDMVIPSTITFSDETYIVTGIGEYAFYFPKNMTSVILPPSLTYISNNAFWGCADLTSIDIPKSVVSIGEQAFWGCSILSSINVDADNPAYVSIDGILYNKDATTIVSYPRGLTEERFSIPETVTRIGSYAFAECTSLTSVTIPKCVTEIGDWAFVHCSMLVSVDIPFGVTRIGNATFWDCGSFTNISIPSSVETIGSEAFTFCPLLTTMAIPESVTSIGYHAFLGCRGLTNVSLPKSVTSLGRTLFWNCEKLSEINVDADNPAYTSVDGILYDKSVSTLLWYPAGRTDTEFSIPGTVESISDSTFYNCTRLTDIVFSGSVKSVGNYSFAGCTGLRTLRLPRSLSKLGKAAFKDCKNLKNIYINYMWGMYQVGSTWDEFPFNGVSNSCSMYVPAGLKEYYESAKFWQNFNNYIGQYHLIKSATAYVYPEPTPTTRIVGGACFEDSIPIREMGFEGHKGITYMSLKSLEPGKENSVVFYAISTDGYKETKEITFTQPALVFTMLQPKGVSSTCSIVAATTNLSEEETNVGFQWKKNDAPASILPKEGLAAIHDGQIEGRINNLQSTSYYDVRAFYKSAAGNYYFSDWLTFDPSDFSYFEPTIQIYAAANVTESCATVRGYVLAGTDEIEEQGFEYWPMAGGESNAKTVRGTMAAAPVAGDVQTVIATGQVMMAELTDLLPGTTYCCRAFVKTSSGIIYGEEQTFTTLDDPTGISGIVNDGSAPAIEGYYDLGGRKLQQLQQGVNIIRFVDGSTKKVFVK